jgi:hypothetical protein
MVDMLNNMATAACEGVATKKIMHYLLASENYPIDKIVIGQNPYPDNIVPYLGSAYSQETGTKNTPSTDVVVKHFPDEPDFEECIRNSWRLLPEGYLFVNSIYDPTYVNDVDIQEKLDQTVELLFLMCTRCKRVYNVSRVTIMAIGMTAQVVYSELAPRLGSVGIGVKKVSATQPASLARITCNTHKVGLVPEYSCFPSGARKFLLEMNRKYKVVQGHPISAILLDMSSKSVMEQVIMASLDDVISSTVRNIEQVGSISVSESDDPEVLKSIITNQNQAIAETLTRVLELAKLLKANSWLTTTVLNKGVQQGGAATKVRTENAPATQFNPVTANPTHIANPSTPARSSSVDDSSSISGLSIDDVLSAQKPAKEVITVSYNTPVAKPKSQSVIPSSPATTPVSASTTKTGKDAVARVVSHQLSQSEIEQQAASIWDSIEVRKR